jgi:ribosomal protein S26
MALNRQQKALINSHIGPRTSGQNCQKKIFQMRTHNFFNTSNRDFYSKKNSVSQVYTYLPKKKLKNRRCLNCALYVQFQMLLHICHLFFQLT